MGRTVRPGSLVIRVIPSKLAMHGCGHCTVGPASGLSPDRDETRTAMGSAET
jgi:hypothetical protein